MDGIGKTDFGGDEQTALQFAYDGGCLAVFSQDGFKKGEAAHMYHAIRGNFPEALVAILVLEGGDSGAFDEGLEEI